MVQNIINVSEGKNRILNIVKAQQGFKNKSQAVEFILEIYADSFLEPELRPEFIKEMRRIEKQKGIPFKDINDLRRQIEG